MDGIEQKLITRYLAKKAKELYRENLALRMFAEYLRERGYQGVDELIQDALDSQVVQDKSEAFEEAIDSKLPSSDEVLLDEDLMQWLASLPTNGLPN